MLRSSGQYALSPPHWEAQEQARLDKPLAQVLGLHAWRAKIGLACHCDLSCGGKWHTATLGLSGPSCPTWATASVMAVSEYMWPSRPMAIPSAPGSVCTAGCADSLRRLSFGSCPTMLCKARRSLKESYCACLSSQGAATALVEGSV